jgi:hypothetical protein
MDRRADGGRYSLIGADREEDDMARKKQPPPVVACGFCGTSAELRPEEHIPEDWELVSTDSGQEWRACDSCLGIITSGEPWRCMSCDTPISRAVASFLFCSDLCQYMGQSVRYRRRIEMDGRADDPLVQLALRQREAWLFAGKVYKPRLVPQQREAAFAAKGRSCTLCGAPATDIDHIDGGGGNDLDNLQPLCQACHLEKSDRSLRPLSPEDPAYAAYCEREMDYLARVAVPTPSRACDDEEHWNTLWRSFQRARRLKDEIGEWMQAASECEEAATEEDWLYDMDEVRHRVH